MSTAASKTVDTTDAWFVVSVVAFAFFVYSALNSSYPAQEWVASLLMLYPVCYFGYCMFARRKSP